MYLGIVVEPENLDECLKVLRYGFNIKSMEYQGNDEEGYDGYLLELEIKEKKIAGRKSKFTDKDIVTMKEMREAGTSLREIGRQMKADAKTISNYLNPQKRKK